MIQIKEFQAKHWYLDDPVEVIVVAPDAIERLETAGVGYSVFDDEKCIMSGGLLYWDNDRGEAWIRLDKCILEHPKWYVRAIVETARIIYQSFKGEIFCWVDEDQPIYNRFVQWFGFTKREELKLKDGKSYRLWEFDRGTNLYDSRARSKRSRSNAASKNGQTASGSPSQNK